MLGFFLRPWAPRSLFFAISSRTKKIRCAGPSEWPLPKARPSTLTIGVHKSKEEGQPLPCPPTHTSGGVLDALFPPGGVPQMDDVLGSEAPAMWHGRET